MSASPPLFNETELRAHLRAAAAQGRAEEVAWLAADPKADWRDRGAAAAALLDARALDPAHGADVFEALTRDLLGQGDVSGAAQAAMAVAHFGSEAALARIETWRALCGVTQSRFWGEPDDGAGGAHLRDEVVGRAWVTPPDARGELTAYVEFAPRVPAPGDERVRSAVVVGGAKGVLEVSGPVIFLMDEGELPPYRLRSLAGGAVEAPAAEVAVNGGEGLAALLAALQRPVEEVVGEVPTLLATLALLRRPQSISGWWLKEKDLGGWWRDAPMDQLVVALDEPALADRVVWAAWAMGRWWRWAGDRAAAASFAALAADAEENWRGSTLLRALILCSRTTVVLPPDRAPKVPVKLRYSRIEPLAVPGYVDAIAKAFADSPEGRVRAAEGSRLGWARIAVVYGLLDQEVTPLAWGPDTLKALLYGVFPEQATAIGTDAPAILADLIAFTSFLERRWEMPGAAALKATLSAPALAEELAVVLDDRSSWFPAKAVMVEARLAGISGKKMEALMRSLGVDGVSDDPDGDA